MACPPVRRISHDVAPLCRAPRRAGITADPPAELAERQRFSAQRHVVVDDVVRQRVHIKLWVHFEYGQDAPEAAAAPLAAAAALAGVAEELAY